MEPPRCPKCDSVMKPGTDVCPGCGETVAAQYSPDAVPGDFGAYYCYRHKRAVTRLRCGRCGRAICPDCALIGPAGPRCPDCGRHKVPVSARAVAHEAKMTFRGLLTGPLRYLWMVILFGLVMTLINTCSGMFAQRSGPAPVDQPDFEQPE